ncbi:MAG: cytochrome c [Verrucomicrobiaceae bacterium]|nr:cytochrome c [Verrucomicrobiaceae bacterium]
MLSHAAEPFELDFNRYLQGKYVYERNCIVCHGARGDGKGEMAANLVPRPRSFREGMFKFRTTPAGKLPTDDDLRHTIRFGLSGTAMGMFSQLADEDVEAVIMYVKSFSRQWRKPENYGEPITVPTAPSWLGKPERVKSGGVLFGVHCAGCHGPSGRGDGPAVPGLKDFWNHPGRPSDLRQPHLRCGDRAEDMYRVLMTGLNGTAMVSFEGVLTADQRWEIIGWLLTQRLPPVATLGAGPPRSAGKPVQ